MERKIKFTAEGGYISRDNTFAGIVGEGGATTLVLSFDDSWAGLTKTVTFYDAQGLNPVAVILTINYMLDTQGLSYAVPIPSEPLAVEGEMSFVVDGVAGGIRQRAFEDRLEVKYAPAVTGGDTPVPPTPSEVEQLQMEIDAMLGLFVTYKTEAGASAAAAADSEMSAANSAVSAQVSAVTAGEYADDVEVSKIAAEASATSSAASKLAAAASETAASHSAADAALSETAAANSADAASGIYNDTVTIKTAAEAAKGAAITAKTSAETAQTGAQTAQTAAEGARDAAVTAKTAAETAKTGAETAQTNAENSAAAASASEDNAADSATLSKSWAVGDTGTRTGENTNNAKYWSDQAALAAGGGVSSFNGRAGVVAPQTGDYTAEMVGSDASGSASAAQSAAESYADTQISAHNTDADAHSTKFAAKADLVAGKVPAAQLPPMNYDPSGTAESAVSAHDASGTAHASLFAQKQAQHLAQTEVIAVMDWTGTVATIPITGVTTDNTVLVAPAPNSQAVYADCEIRCTAQHAGTLTFLCTTTPTAAVTVNVVVMEV